MTGKIWNLEYQVLERGNHDRALLLLRHRIQALRHDPHIMCVEVNDLKDPNTMSLIIYLQVEFHPGLTQPQNKELWHLDVLQGKALPTWYEHLNEDHFYPV